MRRVIFTILSLIAIQFGYAQTTYYWVGGTGSAAAPVSWSATTWNTQLGGGGTDRTTSAATDILIFDGSNLGGGATGPVYVGSGSQTIAKLVLQNNADVAFSRNASGGTSTLLIGDEPNGNDLVVFAGSTLRIRG